MQKTIKCIVHKGYAYQAPTQFIPGDHPAEAWERWKKEYINYFNASELSRATVAQQISDFKNAIGPEGLQYYKNLQIFVAETHQTLPIILEAFTEHYAGYKNESYAFLRDFNNKTTTPSVYTHRSVKVPLHRPIYPKLPTSDEEEEENLGKSDDSKIDQIQKDGNSNYCFALVAVILLVIAIVGAMCFSNDKNALPLPVESLSDDLYSLDKFFPKQSPNVWATIVSGVKDLYTNKPQQPCVILLLVNEDESSNDSALGSTGECLAQLVAQKVVYHLNSESSGPAIVDAGSVRESEYGVALEYFRDKVSSQKALIITNLQDLSGSMAQSLHALCDRYNPIVQDALIVLTLKGHKRRENENIASFAQRILGQLWEGAIPADKLPALLIRIAGNVVAVIPEDTLPQDCDLK